MIEVTAIGLVGGSNDVVMMATAMMMMIVFMLKITCVCSQNTG